MDELIINRLPSAEAPVSPRVIQARFEELTRQRDGAMAAAIQHAGRIAELEDLVALLKLQMSERKSLRIVNSEVQQSHMDSIRAPDD